jgi:hypothetical protein
VLPRHGEIDALYSEQPLILFHERVLGLGQNKLKRGFIKILERRYDRKPANEFRDQAVFEQVLRLDLAEDLALFLSSGAVTLASKPIDPGRLRAEIDLLKASERAARWEQNLPPTILIPDGVGIWTYGDHLRHLAGHAGTISLT